MADDVLSFAERELLTSRAPPRPDRRTMRPATLQSRADPRPLVHRWQPRIE